MQEGRIVEIGTHAELVETNEKYVRMLTHERMSKEELLADIRKLSNVSLDFKQTGTILREVKNINKDTNEEENPNNPGWSVMLKYFKVGYFCIKIYTILQ